MIFNKLTTLFFLFVTGLSAEVLEFEAELTNKSIPAIVEVTKGVVAPITGMSFSADSKRLAVAGYGEVVIWDLEKAKISKRLTNKVMKGRVSKVIFLGNGRVIAGSGEPGTAAVVQSIELSSGRVLFTFHVLNDSVTALECSSDGRLVAVADSTGKFVVLNASTGKVLKEFTDFKTEVTGLNFSKESSRLAACSRGGSLKIWDIKDWEPFANWKFSGSLLGVKFVREGTQMAIGFGNDTGCGVKTERIKNNIGQKKQVLNTNGRFLTSSAKLLDFTLTDNMSTLCMASSDGAIDLIPWNNDFMRTTFKVHKDWVYSVVISPNEQVLATGDAQGIIKLWNTNSRRELATLVQKRTGGIKSVVIHHLGFFAGTPEMVKVRDIESGEISTSFTKRLSQVKNVIDVLNVKPPVKKSKKNKTKKTSKSGRKNK